MVKHWRSCVRGSFKPGAFDHAGSGEKQSFFVKNSTASCAQSPLAAGRQLQGERRIKSKLYQLILGMKTRSQAIKPRLAALALGACVTAQAAGPGITNIAMVPRLTIQSDLGVTNQILYCTNLSGTNWMVLTNLVVAQSPYWFVDVASPPASQRFYVVGLGSNIVSAGQVNPPMRRSAGRVPLMGLTGLMFIRAYDYDVVDWAIWLNQNGYVDAGYDNVLLDAWWGSRDSSRNIIFDPTYFSNGVSWLLNALATNRCHLGVHITINPAEGSPVTSVSTAYNDGLQLASFGLVHLKVDGLGNTPMSEASYRSLSEQMAAGLDDGAVLYGLSRPIYLTVVEGTNWSWLPTVANGVYNSTVVADLTGFGDGLDTSPAQRIAWMNGVLTNCASMVMPGCQMNPEGLGHPWGMYKWAWWNTNYARADMGVFCMGPFPLWIMSRADVGLPCYTNREAITINQDPLVVPAMFLSTNTAYGTNYGLQKVLYRPLQNGDVALGCWNWDTNNASAFTVNLATVPGLATNRATVLDVFGRSVSSVSGTLNSLVNTGGFNLYRLSR
jgi:hypothetical protein